MKKGNTSKIILFLLLILFIVLCVLTVLIIKLKKENPEVSNSILNIKDISNNNDNAKKKETTIKKVVESYGCTYIYDDIDSVYMVSSKNLFEDNGKKNEEFFMDLARDLLSFYENKDFYLIDQEKNIEIKVTVTEERRTKINYRWY